MRKYNEFPSVTTVLSIYNQSNSYLQRWLAIPENRKSMEESGRFGTAVHKLIENFFNNNYDEEFLDNNEVYDFYSKHFKPYCEENKDKVLLFEQKLISTDLALGGTLDLYLSDGTIVDFKTSHKEKQHLSLESYKMQLAAYGALVKSNYPHNKIKKGRLHIGVKSTDKLQIVEIERDELQFYFNKFMMYRKEFYDLHGF